MTRERLCGIEGPLRTTVAVIDGTDVALSALTMGTMISTTNTTRLGWSASLLAVATLLAPNAFAQSGEVSGFTVSNVRELTDFTLDDRFPETGVTERVISIDDCELYTGQRVAFDIGLDAPEAGDLIVKLNAPETTCNDNTISEETECITLEKQVDWTDTSVTFNLDMDQLMFGNSADDCLSNERETTFNIFFMHQGASEASPASSSIPFRLDLKAPEAPEISSTGGGDGQVTVVWTDTNDETVTYKVYWSTTTLDDGSKGAADSVDGLTATSYSITSGIVNGTTYNVAISAVDEAGNESTLSIVQSATAQPSTDYWEHYQGLGGTDTGGFCFIATVSYGTPMAGELNTLRAFRDNVLLPTDAGRAFVEEYYAWGRFAAAWIADKPALKAVARVLLAPLVWFAELALATSLGWALVLVLMMLGGLMAVGRAYRNHVARQNPGAYLYSEIGA